MNNIAFAYNHVPAEHKYEICVDLRRFGFDWRWSELLNRHGTQHLYNYSNCGYFRCIICLLPEYGYLYTLRNRCPSPCDDPQDHDWVYHAKDPRGMFIVPLLECTRCSKLWVTPEYSKKEKMN